MPLALFLSYTLLLYPAPSCHQSEENQLQLTIFTTLMTMVAIVVTSTILAASESQNFTKKISQKFAKFTQTL